VTIKNSEIYDYLVSARDSYNADKALKAIWEVPALS
jgi:hypothetical protein